MSVANCQVVACDLDRQLDNLSERLGARPLDVPACQASLDATLEGCRAAAKQLLQVRDQLVSSQVSTSQLLLQTACTGRQKGREEEGGGAEAGGGGSLVP